MGVDDVAQWVQIAVGVVTFVSIIWLSVVRPLMGSLKRIDDRLEKAERLAEVVDHIKAELQPNGGSSLKDQVSRIETGLSEVKGRMDAHIDLHLQQGRDK